MFDPSQGQTHTSLYPCTRPATPMEDWDPISSQHEHMAVVGGVPQTMPCGTPTEASPGNIDDKAHHMATDALRECRDKVDSPPD